MSDAGRPTVMTPEVLEKLRVAFLMGCTDVEACLYANIGTTALYTYQRENPEYKQLKDEWKEHPALLARKTVYDNLSEDKQTAQWYLERKNKKEFSARQEVTGEDGKALQISFDPVFNATTRQTERDSSESSQI